VGLCEVVGSLADAVAAKYENRNAWHNLLIHILRSASVYRDAGRLDAWDETYRYARSQENRSTSLTELLDAIADLGTYNLYGAVDAPGTQEKYDRVVKLLQAEGVQVPSGFDLMGW
jgi:hypothetical protein